MNQNDTSEDDMFHGGREELVCNCGNGDLKIAVNETAYEVIIGCPECRKDILRASIKWIDDTPY